MLPPFQITGEGWKIARSSKGILSVYFDASISNVTSQEAFIETWQKALEENAPCLHLFDAGSGVIQGLSARWRFARRMQKNKALFKKSAVIGLVGTKQAVARVIIRSSGRDNIRMFLDRAEAEAWLLEKD